MSYVDMLRSTLAGVQVAGSWASQGRMRVSGKNILDENSAKWCMRGFVYGLGPFIHSTDFADDKLLGANCVRIPNRVWGLYNTPNIDEQSLGQFADMLVVQLAGLKANLVAAKQAGLKTNLFYDSNCGQNGNQSPADIAYCTVGGVGGQNYWTANGAAQRASHLLTVRITMRILRGLVDFFEPLVECDPTVTGNTIADMNQLYYDTIAVALQEDPYVIPIIGGLSYQQNSILGCLSTLTYQTSPVLTCDLLDNAMTNGTTWASALTNMGTARTTSGFPVISQQAGTKFSSEAGAPGQPNDSDILFSRLDSLNDGSVGDGKSVGWTYWTRVTRFSSDYGCWIDPTGTSRTVNSQNRIDGLSTRFKATPLFF